MSSQHTPSVSGSDASGAGFTSNADYGPRGGNHWFPDIPRILPHEMVFPIQIGSELFRLSGASISSDAPSYFSQFFERQLVEQEERPHIRTLYIDRDPETFRDIARHLQGYHIAPRDGAHFVRLFADAQFYSLPKLMSQLFEAEIYISIGGKPFQINRDVFQSPGNTPNFFTLGFAVFFSNPVEVFPGLNREGLLRPPSILPPEVPNRSPEVFAEIIHLLRGYPLHIRDEEHRQQLIRDCKYYSFKGLEQRLYQHNISWNASRGRFEIAMRLADIKPSGISISPDHPGSAAAEYDAAGIAGGGQSMSEGWIMYARPFVDEQSRELVLEISNESTRLNPRNGYVEFFGLDKKRMTSLLKVIKSKLGLEVSQEWPMGLRMMETINGNGHGAGMGAPEGAPWSGHRVKFLFDEATDLALDGVSIRNAEGMLGRDDGVDASRTPRSSAVVPVGLSGGEEDVRKTSPDMTSSSLASMGDLQRKRLKRKHEELTGGSEWIIKRGQWRLRVQKTAASTPRADGAAAGAAPLVQLKSGGGLEIVLVAVKLDAFSGEHGRNQKRTFLS